MASQDLEQMIRDGRLARLGALSMDDIKRAAEVIKQVHAEQIETVRVLFADPHGTLRGKTVTAHALADAFTSGVHAPSTLLLKDVTQKTVFPVWLPGSDSPLHGVGDILMAPDPQTFRILPWSPHSALLLTNLYSTDGKPLAISSRGLLQNACSQLRARKHDALFGLEVEFQVFEVVDAALNHPDTTMPGRPPVTRATHQGYQYLSETRYGEVEPLLDRLRRAAQGMGMPVRSVEIEMGPSQFEFTFDRTPGIVHGEAAARKRVRQWLAHTSIDHRPGRAQSVCTRRPYAYPPSQRMDCRIAAQCGRVLYRYHTDCKRLQTLRQVPARTQSHRVGARQPGRHVTDTIYARRVSQSY